MESPGIKSRIVESKPVFYAALGVVVIILLFVWLTGYRAHRSLFQNALIDIGITSAAFFIFTAIGLYRGIKMRHTMDTVSKRISRATPRNSLRWFNFLTLGGDIAIGEGILGFILSLILSILISVLILFVVWVLGVGLWVLSILFFAVIYWLFFRALQFVFRHSPVSRGDYQRSFYYAFGYSVLYGGLLVCVAFIMERVMG